FRRRRQRWRLGVPAATDRSAPKRCVKRPGARQRRLPDAKNFGEKVSRRPPNLMNRSLQLDVSRPDYLAPFLSFISDKLAEIGGRAGKWGFPEIEKPFLHLCIGKASVDLLVELADDLSGRA